MDCDKTCSKFCQIKLNKYGDIIIYHLSFMPTVFHKKTHKLAETGLAKD